MLNCLTEFVLVHPPGASEVSESYAFRFLKDAPRVGDEYGLDGQQWVVAQTYSYSVSASTPGLTTFVEVAVCTLDGSVPKLERLDEQPLTMYLPVSTDEADGEAVTAMIASNPDGSSRFGVVENVSHIPFHNLVDGWKLKHCQAFNPVGEVAPPGFAQIVLCWCNAGVAIAA